MFNKKKENEDNGLDILEEIKEPFSLTTFYEDHIVKNIKRIKRMLDERGILFFFLSPFQQRNRLIIQLVLIIFGIVAGLVPRSMTLISQVKERNANSEMAALIDNETVITVGSINIKPLSSSQYERQHVLAFLITPSHGQIIPSIADRYFVNISVNRGVLDGDKVKYAYELIPYTENSHIMLIYTDNSDQQDNTGIYNVLITNKEDQLDVGKQLPFEVVLSDTQKTTSLFDVDGIHVNSLSDILFTDAKEPIKKARTDLETQLKNYTLETERIANQPIEMNPVPSPAVLTEFAHDNEIYPLITDTSNVADIINTEELTELERNITVSYKGAIELNGTLYNNEYFTNDVNIQNGFTDDQILVQNELASLQEAIDNVTKAVTTLNNATLARYDDLINFKLIFDRIFDPTTFTHRGNVSLTLQTFTGDEDASTESTEEIPVDDTSTEEGISEETPVEETPTEETPVEETSTEETPTEEIPSTEVSTETPTEEIPVQ